jgi:hypothetical protein
MRNFGAVAKIMLNGLFTGSSDGALTVKIARAIELPGSFVLHGAWIDPFRPAVAE